MSSNIEDCSPAKTLIQSSHKQWCTIADVKITFSDDSEDSMEANRELLDEAIGRAILR